MCRSRGCCWQPNATVRCSYPSNHGYRLDGRLEDVPFGVMATLVREESFPSMFGGDSKRLKVHVTYETDYRLRVKVINCTLLFIVYCLLFVVVRFMMTVSLIGIKFLLI